MENLLVVLEQLISNLGSDIIDKNHNLKQTFLQYESEYIKPDQINNVEEYLAELVSVCDFQLMECCRLVDLIIHLQVSLKGTKELLDDDRGRLKKCEDLMEDFKRLTGVYKELVQKIADLRSAI